MFLTDKAFPAQLVKRAFDGCAGKVQLRSDGIDCEPAASFCIGMILQAAIDDYRTVSQTRIVDGIEMVQASSPDLSRKIGLRGKGARSSRDSGCGRSFLATGAGGCFFRMAASSASLSA